MKSPFKTALAAVAFSVMTAGMSLAQADTFKVTFSAGHGTQLPWIRMIKEFYMPEVDKRLLAAGAGAVPVQGDFATHFNNIKTGVYDGLIAFTTGMYPAKLHQVAPTATRIDLGSMTIGALTINKAFNDKLPPEVQKIIKDVGREYTVKIAEQLMTLAVGFEKKMVEEGAKFTKLPADERKKWANTMPNIAKNWVEANEKRQIPAGKVLSVYMKKLRDNNVQLVRDWDKN